MDKTSMNALVIGGSAVAGGMLGTWAGAKLGASYGLRAGPWGIIAGALAGAVAGAALTGILGRSDESTELENDIP